MWRSSESWFKSKTKFGVSTVPIVKNDYIQFTLYIRVDLISANILCYKTFKAHLTPYLGLENVWIKLESIQETNVSTTIMSRGTNIPYFSRAVSRLWRVASWLLDRVHAYFFNLLKLNNKRIECGMIQCDVMIQFYLRCKRSHPKCLKWTKLCLGPI